MTRSLRVLGTASLTVLLSPGLIRGQSATITGLVHVPNPTLSDALVYLVPTSRTVPEPNPEPGPVVMDQRNLHFVPHTLAVLPGQEVAFRNSDPLLHNVFSPDTTGEDFDLGTYPSGDWRTHTFRREGAHVILCHIHPEMEAYVVVIPTAYTAVVDAEGRFRLEDVPPGGYTIHVWHPRAAPYERRARLGVNETVSLVIELERRGKRRNR